MTPHRFEHEELRERISNAKAILNVPVPQYDGEPEVKAGKHYDVLAVEPWEGYFIPTRVEWAHGPTDDFTDLMHSLDLRDVALATVGDA